MKSIAVFNQKGGVGKTSTIFNLMAEFTRRGKKVLALDLDSQGNLSRVLGVATENENTIRELLLGEATFDETLRHTKYGDLIPADEALQSELLRFATMPAFILRLKRIMQELAEGYGYDLVLMDCAPSPNQVTASALVAADYTIIPTEAEFFSADGVAKLRGTIEQVRQLNPALAVMGILIVKYNGRRSLTQALERVLDDAAGEAFGSKMFETKIRFTVDVPSSQAMQLSLYDYKKSSKAAEDFARLADEISEVLK